MIFMDDQNGPSEDGVSENETPRRPWSAPRLTVIPIVELTAGANGPNFDGDFSPQS